MLMGRTAAPLPDLAVDGSPVADLVSGRDPVVIDTSPGSFLAAALASDLARRGRRALWARLAPYEIDLSSLTSLARAVAPATADRAPPVAVVESADENQARAFLGELDTLVATGARRPPDAPATVVLHMLPDQRRDGSRRPALPTGGRELAPWPVLTDPDLERRLTALLAGRLGLRGGVARATPLLGRDTTADVVHAAGSAEELTRGLAAALLADAPAEYRRQLRLAALLGYAHQRLEAFDRLLPDVPIHPWWLPLEGGWFQVDPAWRPALTGVDTSPLPVSTVARVVGDLVDLPAPEEALELSLDAACPGLASDLLAELAPGLLAADRTRALRRWLTRLPPQEHARHAPLLARLGAPNPAAVAAPRHSTGQRHWWPERPRPLLRHHRWNAPRQAPGPGDATAIPASASPAPSTHIRTDPLSVTVRLLGAVEVRLSGRTVEHWHGRVGRTALAYVLLQRRRVSPDELAGALWPDAPATIARNRLHVALHRLRADLAAVDPRPVLVHEQGYAVDPDVRVDLDTDRFERLGDAGDEALRGDHPDGALTAYLAALDGYGGDLLAGERDDEWAVLTREHYRVRLLDVLGKAAHLAIDLDRPALAVNLGQRLLALDFCREDLHRLLMRAYARLGQPQLALRQYQTCVRQLRLEFGLDPAPATVQLFDQVRCQVPV
jgi:DNA-binding SARP family transcriptional activator